MSLALRSPIALLTLLLSGCFAPAYLAQAGYGQLEMARNARPIDEVIADPETDEGTRTMLMEVDGIKGYAREVGLTIDGNYRHYIELDRSAAVWFVAASRPLAFEPKVWCWPIVGCFPMLGWFDLEQAKEFRRSLEADGWEVLLRGAAAYSTAGWFRDPVVSSMLRAGDNSYGTLVNVILHELMHVTVLVEDQAYFNESVAAFTADGMADTYLERRFGADSPELAAYRADIEEEELYGQRMWKAYQELDAIYQSDRTDAAKRAAKNKVIDRLTDELLFVRRPNNATLIGFKTYRTGFDDFARLRRACGSWPRFLRAVKSVRPKHFDKELAESFTEVIRPMLDGCTPRR
jgi:predicted aminopeptidase